MNVYRTRPGKPATEYLAWSPTGTYSYHTSQRMGYILLESLASQTSTKSIRVTPVPSDADVEWLKPMDAAAMAEVDHLILELDNADEAIRTKAADALRAYSDKRLSAPVLMRGKLGTAAGQFRRENDAGIGYHTAAALHRTD